MQFYKALVLDNHRMFADGFCELLKKKIKSFTVIDPCYSIEAARNKIELCDYDYFFLDISIRDKESKELMFFCRKKFPKLIIVAVSSLNDAFEIKEILSIGIHGFLSKSAGSEELQTAIARTLAGEKYISVELAGKLVTSIYTKDSGALTKKELQVVRLVAKGLTIIEAANEMHLSQHTIIGHRRNIMQKLGVRSATGIVKYAFENKLL